MIVAVVVVVGLCLCVLISRCQFVSIDESVFVCVGFGGKDRRCPVAINKRMERSGSREADQEKRFGRSW